MQLALFIVVLVIFFGIPLVTGIYEWLRGPLPPTMHLDPCRDAMTRDAEYRQRVQHGG